MTEPGRHHEPGTYELRLRGHLDQRWTARLGLSTLIQEDDGTTVMTATVADQAALHGLLQRIRDLGLPLIAVIRIGG